MQNDASAEKADAGQDTLDDAADRVGIADQVAVGRSKNEDRRSRRAETDESVSAQASGLPVQLTVQSKKTAGEKGSAQTQRNFSVRA